MSVSSFVAKRYISASRRDRFFSWVSLLSISGICIGVAALIVVLSVIDGFEDELRNRFLAANAHVLAYRYPAGLSQHKVWQKNFLDKFGQDITGIAPFVHADTMGRKDHIIHSMLVKGITPHQRESVQKLRHMIRPPEALDLLEQECHGTFQHNSDHPPGVILGVGLASVMRVKVGDTVALISPSEDSENPFGQTKPFRVVGVYDSGLQHYDSKLALLSLPAAQHLFHMGDIVTGLEIGLKHPDDSVQVANAMTNQFNLSIKQWQSFNQNIFAAMRNEKTVIGFIVALVAFVASFNILITLFVSVTHKQRDISILRALGASRWHILTIFLKQSIWMGILGGVLGMVLAYGLSLILKHAPFIHLPDIYMLATLPVEMSPWVYLSVTAAGVLTAGLAGLYPAWSATRVSPTHGFQHTV